jgi:hypothetical protein
LSKLFQFFERDSDIAHDTGKAFWLDGAAFNQLPSRQLSAPQLQKRAA